MKSSFFLKARTDVLYQRKSFRPGVCIAYEYTYDSKIIVLGLKGIEALNHINQLLISDNSVSKQLSYKLIRKQTEIALGEIVFADPKGIEKRAREVIDAMIDKLEKTMPSCWTVIIPLVNLVLKVDTVIIGLVKIELCNTSIINDFVIH
jgi:hypothetical protein